jgi:hypothetical protein
VEEEVEEEVEGDAAREEVEEVPAFGTWGECAICRDFAYENR